MPKDGCGKCSYRIGIFIEKFESSFERFMKVSKILLPTPITLSLSYISYIFSDLQPCPFIYQPHHHSPLPQQPWLSNFPRLPTIRWVLESIKYSILVIIIICSSSISIILFLLFELDFLFLFEKTYQDILSEYFKISVSWNVAPMEHI